MRLHRDAFDTRRFTSAVKLHLQNAFRHFFTRFAARFYHRPGSGKKHRVTWRAREKFDALGGLTAILLKAKRKIAEITENHLLRPRFGFSRIDTRLNPRRAVENFYLASRREWRHEH